MQSINSISEAPDIHETKVTLDNVHEHGLKMGHVCT